jgi:hypothetical protein
VVLDGRTVQSGTRDCEERWRLIAPHLENAGTLLDVGSNFGWFGLRACRENERLVVASVEADLRSAAVQRQALRSHGHARVCLLTDPASACFVARFAAAGQRFDAALCLNVLHWMRDYRCFLVGLGAIAGRIIVEHPHADEAGAGVERIRREIGPIGRTLGWLFPDRPVTLLGEVRCHRTSGSRQVWLVDHPRGWRPAADDGLDAAALLASGLSWPPRSWWQAELAALRSPPPSTGELRPREPSPRPRVCAHGLSTAAAIEAARFHELARTAALLPEEGVLSLAGHLRRQYRRVVRWTARRCQGSKISPKRNAARLAALALRLAARH